MIKTYGLLPRSRKISRQHFHLHLAIVHRREVEPITAIKKYMQFHMVEDNVAPFKRSVYDGLVECWFDSQESFAELTRQDPFYTEKIQKEEYPYYIDLDGPYNTLATEEEIPLAGPTLTPHRAFTKGTLFVHRRPDVTREEFVTWYRQELPELAQRTVPGLSRYTQNLPIDEFYGGDVLYDAVVELWRGNPASQDNAPLDLTGFAAALEKDSPVDVANTSSATGQEYFIR
ncbi:EthD domain-containing protein [Amycolatopsis sp. NPDC004368]